MFYPEIEHAEDMIERAEAEAKLSPASREMLPAHRRVPIKEAIAWQVEVERKLQALADEGSLRRLNLLSEEWTRQIDAGEGDELARFINYAHGVLRLLRQVQSRREHVTSTAPAPAADPATTKPKRPAAKRHDVFISHASEDKAAFARPLYEALAARRVTAWFDQATLELGDSLRRKIDEGLAGCRFGVVILSPSFLAKEWPQRELDALVARETAAGKKAILPVLHNLSIAELATRSPLLADRLSADSSAGVEAVADEIAAVVARKRRDA